MIEESDDQIIIRETYNYLKRNVINLEGVYNILRDGKHIMAGERLQGTKDSLCNLLVILKRRIDEIDSASNENNTNP